MMISYGKQSIDQSDIDTVVEVLKRDWLTQRPAVETFEYDLKDYFGAKHCCAVSNGTAALHLTGLALSWQSEDIIITTPITFLATANCIVYAGATPEFVDIDPITYTMDTNQLEQKVKAKEVSVLHKLRNIDPSKWDLNEETIQRELDELKANKK